MNRNTATGACDLSAIASVECGGSLDGKDSITGYKQ